MENASKALIMAAGVLIGIMILSLAVYLFATFGSTSAELHKQKETDQLNQFNSQFTSYEGKEDITIYDVITVANLATENNKYYEFDTNTSMPTNDKVADNYIWVELYGDTGLKGTYSYGKDKTNDKINEQYDGLINEELKKINNNKRYLPIYNCETYISSITGRVYRVKFILKK